MEHLTLEDRAGHAAELEGRFKASSLAQVRPRSEQLPSLAPPYRSLLHP